MRSVQSTRGGTPCAKRLESDAECGENIGEELHSHFNYKWDTLDHLAFRSWATAAIPS